MNRIGRILTPLLALGLAGVLFWIFRESDEPAPAETPAVPQTAEQSIREPQEILRASIPKPSDTIAQQPVDTDAAPYPLGTPPVSPLSGIAPIQPATSRISTNDLKAILPLWMQEEAEVDAYADERVVAGVPVTRVRGRYAWTNGSRMEVEISDLGEEPSDLLLRSVGYNTTASNTVTEAGFSMEVDGAEDPTRFEYDYQTGEGSLQMLVAGRFLVEVQLELLLPESFEAVIEHQVPIAVLEEMAAEDRKP